jgi:hypothetical protein
MKGPGPAGDHGVVEPDSPGPPGESVPEGPADDPPLTDPAHRAARWFMMLAPVLLVIAVLLLLRLSTG